LLFLGSKGNQHRPDEIAVLHVRVRRRCELQLLLEEILSNRPPSGSAPFDRPVRGDPSAVIENAMPFDHLVTRDPLLARCLLAYRGRQGRVEERPYLVAKGLVLGGKPEIHLRLLFRPTAQRRPLPPAPAGSSSDSAADRRAPRRRCGRPSPSSSDASSRCRLRCAATERRCRATESARFCPSAAPFQKRRAQPPRCGRSPTP